MVRTTDVSARCFRGAKSVSGIEKRTFTKVKPHPSEKIVAVDSGLSYAYFEGDWGKIPAFGKLHAVKKGVVRNFDLSPRTGGEHFGFEFKGYIRIPADGMYTFDTESDDGSRLFVGPMLVVDNDGTHAMVDRKGVTPLAKGLHPLKVEFFQKSGGIGLHVSMEGPAIKRIAIPDSLLFHHK